MLNNTNNQNNIMSLYNILNSPNIHLDSQYSNDFRPVAWTVNFNTIPTAPKQEIYDVQWKVDEKLYFSNPGLKKDIKGINNGTWGFGMIGNIMPSELNGPFGYQEFPQPLTIEHPANYTDDPKYNSNIYNGPFYNQSQISKMLGGSDNIMSDEKWSPFNFNNYTYNCKTL